MFWGTVQSTSNLNLRALPSTTIDERIFTVPSGSVLNVVGRSIGSAWLYVEHARLYGWVYASFTTVTPDSLPTMKVITATVG